jgi:Zn-dependent peptidase ImmA (M78 family)
VGFRAPFLQYDHLRPRAEAFLAEHHPGRAIPVPIEYIVECRFGIDIVPVPGLQDAFDTVAYLTHDLSEIRVDEHVYLKRPNRYRFSLAHEMGHRVLHADIFKELKFDTVEQWKRAITHVILEDQYSFLEFQAYSFAGLVLVPSEELRGVFFDCVELAQQHDIDFDERGTGAREAVEDHIAKIFEVSSDVIHRRIEYDSLWHE